MFQQDRPPFIVCNGRLYDDEEDSPVCLMYQIAADADCFPNMSMAKIAKINEASSDFMRIVGLLVVGAVNTAIKRISSPEVSVEESARVASEMFHKYIVVISKTLGAQKVAAEGLREAFSKLGQGDWVIQEDGTISLRKKEQ